MMTVPTSRLPQTSYQMHPDADHLNDQMLPAVALSNFFHPPAANISDGEKLPVMRAPRQIKGQQTRIDPSLHKKTRCLAELIQCQLLELKKIQARYSRSGPEKRLSLSLDVGLRSRVSPTSALRTIPLNAMSKSMSPLPASPGRSSFPSVSQKLLTNRPHLDKISTRASLGSMSRAVRIDLEPAPLTDRSLTSINVKTAFRSSNMDPCHFAAIHRWVKDVEQIHKAEGKFVIPALENHNIET